MTERSDDQNPDLVDDVTELNDEAADGMVTDEPAAEPALRISVLGPGGLDDLTHEKAELSTSTARAAKALSAAADLQFADAAKRMSNILSGYELTKMNSAIGSAMAGFESSGALKSILGTTALTRPTAMTSLIEALGRSSADRAAFSIASGLKVSDSVTSTIAKLMAETHGVGMARSALAGTLGETLKAFDLGRTTNPALAALAKDSLPKVDISGFESVVNKAAFSNLEGIRSVLETFAGADFARTRSLAMQQLVATSGIADFIGSDKMIASWRQSLLSEATARSLIGTMAVPHAGAGLLRDIVVVNAATARVVGRYAELNKANILAPAVSARPTRELRSYLAAMPAGPDIEDLTFALRASRGVAGIAAADLIVADAAIEDEATDLLEVEVVEPWLTGPEAARDLMFARLGALDPLVPDLLRGAWAQVELNGPAATSMACHAAQEVIDRTLRAIASDDLVLQLYLSGHLPKDSIHEKGGERLPTRRGRIAAALHERNPGETKLIAAEAKAIADTVTNLTRKLQGGKHASNGTVGLVRTWLVSVEATFTQLLYEPGDG